METSTDISRALSLVNKWATTLLFPEEDPFDEIKPVHTEIVEIGQEEKVIVLSLPLNDEVTSNVRRISVPIDFDGATPPSLDIQVRQSNNSSVTHTCKKREIPEIYLRNFFWTFRKILG